MRESCRLASYAKLGFNIKTSPFDPTLKIQEDMVLKIKFKDGSLVTYPNGAGYSTSPDGTLTFINDVSGTVIAVVTTLDVDAVVRV